MYVHIFVSFVSSLQTTLTIDIFEWERGQGKERVDLWVMSIMIYSVRTFLWLSVDPLEFWRVSHTYGTVKTVARNKSMKNVAILEEFSYQAEFLEFLATHLALSDRYRKILSGGDLSIYEQNRWCCAGLHLYIHFKQNFLSIFILIAFGMSELTIAFTDAFYITWRHLICVRTSGTPKRRLCKKMNVYTLLRDLY